MQSIRNEAIKVLKNLYDETHGSRREFVNFYEKVKLLGYDPQNADRIFDYLRGEGLVKSIALDGYVVLTHAAIKLIEEELQE
ncbi:hypothetical protein [Fervidobacterium pennivorans]|uniref:hypothetical protein n=1 Tax=Fervidobacterium pennivorans TaxID=93466 RepID=UPI0014366FF4|nr:hypothetical protein [Fervidobacterium pennivorans]QIV77639.1 hypothetical protein HER11_00550 [Fervidobacterium pennivorans subsp. keratinolyticus]